MSWRSERIENRIWISAARSSRSGAIEGRPSEVKLGEFRIERGKRRVHERPDLAKRMMGGNTVFQIDVAEHRPSPPILSAHENLLRQRAKGIIFA